MRFRLVGRDFQSWKQFDLRVSGFTIIVGSSNRGKTAIVRALRGILRNQVSAAFVRHGQKTVDLSLEVEGGPTATLQRGKTTSYTVNGEDFAKLAGGVPKPLQDLNVHEITVGTTKLDPTFAGQFDSQFMMALTPGDLNAVFGLFSNTEQLNQGKKNINLNNTEINSQAKGLAEDIQNGHIKIAAIEEILSHFKTLRPQHDEATQRIVSAQTVQTLASQRAAMVQTVWNLRKAASQPIPTTEQITRLLGLGKALRQAQKLRQYVQTGSAATISIPVGDWSTRAKRWHLLSQYWMVRTRIKSQPPTTPISADGLEADAWNYRALNTWLSKRYLIASLKSSVRRNDDGLKLWHDELHELTKDTTECPKCGYQFTTEQS